MERRNIVPEAQEKSVNRPDPVWTHTECRKVLLCCHSDMPSRFLTIAAWLAVFSPMGIGKDINIVKHYRDTANKLIDAALADESGYEKLTYLCDRIGNRLSGSENL